MRAIWTGSIGFGLVNIPVKLYGAIQESRLDLDMLDKKDHSRIRFQRINEKTGKEVAWENIVKAYNYNDKYIVLDEHDYEDASPKKSKIIEISSFAGTDEIDAVYFETAYFIEPDKGGGKAYQLLLKTLEKTRKVGVALFVLRTQEHLAVVRANGDYLMLHRLRFAEEVREPDELKLPDSTTIPKKELDMAVKLVESYSETFDISAYKDTYREELLRIIKAKAAGKRAVVKKMKVATTKGTDLFEQLKASLGTKKRVS